MAVSDGGKEYARVEVPITAMDSKGLIPERTSVMDTGVSP